jgi:hypothetical protein
MKTKPTTLSQLSRRKIDKLMTQEMITQNDIEDFSQAEIQYLEEKATKTLAKLKGTARDSFLDKIQPIVPASTKNDTWEYNHMHISNAISNYMHLHGAMPCKNDIAEETGLSRQTVAKHMIEYKQHPEFIGEMEQFKFMSNQILTNVFKYANKGDMRAARLYFEMVGTLNKQPNGTVVNEQNHYIQINNTILSQEKLKQLSNEQLTLIENIVTNKEYITLSEVVASKMLGR